MMEPDVAEVMAVIQDLDAVGDDAVNETATWFGLHPGQVRAAVRYTAEFPGHDVIALQDEDRRYLRGSSNAEVFAFAQEMGWTIVTENSPHFRPLADQSYARGETVPG